MPPDRQNPIDRFILYQYRTKPEWQYLEKEPKQAYRLENSIDNQPIQWNSHLIHFFCIVGILLSIALFFYMIFFCVAVVIIGTDLCV